MSKNGIVNVLWLALALAYLVIRFGFTRELDARGVYASYILEVVLVIVALVLYGRRSLTLFNVPFRTVFGNVFALAAGFSVYKFATLTGIPIPFDLQGTMTLVFLLAVAPLLEEAVFRFFLWKPLEQFSRPWFAWLATSAIFSYSHFHAIWFVPAEIHSFLVYQTVYTFVLGLVCGYFVWRFNSLAGAISIHFGFNLGFYLASQI